MTARFALALLLVAALAAATSCDRDVNMDKQPHYRPLQSCTFFDDGASARPVPEGTVSSAAELFTSTPPTSAPPQPPLSLSLMQRGHERFDIRCSPCHGRDGYGRGMVVQRGYPLPPSYHDTRLRSVPDDYIYRVITYGLGKMPVYGKDVRPADRWAIIAYVRALQLSQYATVSDVPPNARAALMALPTTQASEP